jgi:hypothetical protein
MIRHPTTAARDSQEVIPGLAWKFSMEGTGRREVSTHMPRQAERREGTGDPQSTWEMDRLS